MSTTTGSPVATRGIRLIVSDVDGVWTDGSIHYSGDAREVKVFNVRDGLGVKLAQKAGIAVAVITSRRSRALERRCRELGIAEVAQGTTDKLAEMTRLAARLEVPLEEVCYVGDDLPDLAPARAAGLSAAPSDAAPEVLGAVDWPLQSPGGHGVLRELIERLLRERGTWDAMVQEFDRGAVKTPAT